MRSPSTANSFLHRKFRCLSLLLSELTPPGSYSGAFPESDKGKCKGPLASLPPPKLLQATA